MKRAAALLFLAAFTLAGCLSPFTRKAKSILHLPSGALVDQAGTVETPAHVESKASDFSFVIPKDSVFSIDTALQTVSLRFSRDTPATASARQESGTAAIPTAPATPQQIATAQSLARFYWLALGLALLAGLLAWREHFKAAAIAAACAVSVPILARFFSSDLAQYVALGGVCIAGTLYVAWHIMNGHYRTAIVDAVEKIEVTAKKVL